MTGLEEFFKTLKEQEMKENLTNITIKLPAKDWKRMAELYGKNRAWKIRLAIQELIKKAEEKKQ